MADKKKKQTREIQELANELTQFQISGPSNPTKPGNDKPLKDISPNNTTIDPEIRPNLSLWPRLQMRVPAIFVHERDKFRPHAKKLVAMGTKFACYYNTKYSKVTCKSFNDHKTVVQCLEKNQIPYHTFGHPSKRKMKVVIRGLPNDIDLNKIKEELKFVSVPVIRVHKMSTKIVMKDNSMLVLAVVPFDDNGKRMLKVSQILGHKVTLEPPIPKVRQCYRCQRWGHSQRYCHGLVKCLKCSGDHLYKKCDRNPEKDPPKCANCGGEHTANYRKCPRYPKPPEVSTKQRKLLKGLKPIVAVD